MAHFANAVNEVGKKIETAFREELNERAETTQHDLEYATKIVGAVADPSVPVKSHGPEAVAKALNEKGGGSWTKKDLEKMNTAIGDLNSNGNPSDLKPGEYAELVSRAYNEAFVDPSSKESVGVGDSYFIGPNNRRFEYVGHKYTKAQTEVKMFRTTDASNKSFLVAVVPGSYGNRSQNWEENASIAVRHRLRPDTHMSVLEAIQDLGKSVGNGAKVLVVAGNSLGGHIAQQIAADDRTQMVGFTVNPYNTKPTANTISYQTDMNVTSTLTDHEVRDTSVDTPSTRAVRGLRDAGGKVSKLRQDTGAEVSRARQGIGNAAIRTRKSIATETKATVETVKNNSATRAYHQGKSRLGQHTSTASKKYVVKTPQEMKKDIRNLTANGASRQVTRSRNDVVNTYNKTKKDVSNTAVRARQDTGRQAVRTRKDIGNTAVRTRKNVGNEAVKARKNIGGGFVKARNHVQNVFGGGGGLFLTSGVENEAEGEYMQQQQQQQQQQQLEEQTMQESFYA